MADFTDKDAIMARQEELIISYRERVIKLEYELEFMQIYANSRSIPLKPRKRTLRAVEINFPDTHPL